MNRILKTVARCLLPVRLFSTIQSIRSRNYQMRLLKEWGVTLATREMVDVHGTTVLYGPFRGMTYPTNSLMSRNGIPIVFGTYEEELHPVIEEVMARRYDFILNVGAGEGYYSVGLALRTKTPVHAFDCEPRERRYNRQMARMNSVDHLVRIRPWCDAKLLGQLVNSSRCLIFSDCEGFELELFGNSTIPTLRNSDLIIEIHELFPARSVEQSLLERFEASHESRAIAFDSKGPTRVPKKWQAFAREFRPDNQRWLFLSPKLLTRFA